MIVISRFTPEAHACAYLPEQQARLQYELVAQLSPEEYEARMDAGWRKFGALLFQPVCAACRECRPIRILADAFRADRSQERALKRNGDLRVEFSTPSVDAERLSLYQRYHEAQAVRKKWPYEEIDRDEYHFRFLHNPIPSIEVSVWEGEHLRAIALTDLTPNTVSGVYHYHEPECRSRSLGAFVMIQTILLAQKLGKPYAYFGYYVRGCSSMAYKARFRPCEVLDSDGVWRAFDP